MILSAFCVEKTDQNINRVLSGKILKAFVVLTAFFFGGINLSAQEIKIEAGNQPLSEVLINLRDNYGIQLSFNHEIVSKCIVSKSKNYSSPKQAISELVSSCNLAYEFSDGVFIIFEKPQTDSSSVTKSQKYFFSGQLIDALSTEPLPFSSIQINKNDFIADASGNFSFKTTNVSEKLKVSHLGYFLLDTILSPGNNQRIKLTPSVVGLQEVLVNSDVKIFSANIGERPGLVKLNHKVATFLPGNNNNTLFNLLRLQPGVTAAAEQSSDYIIWGSYRGQNLLLFDGIPLFSANSLNNEIGIANPLMVKDVEVFKGGFNVDKGDRVGGVINMTGNTGNTDSFSANVNVNSQTVSGLLNIPLAKKYAFQAAFRQSYYSVIDWNEVLNNSTDDNIDSYTPEYQFQDLNIKFSGRTDKGDNFYVSLLGNNDNSSFEVINKEKYKEREWENKVEKQQLGGAAFYNKNWNRAGRTNITVSYSSLVTNSFDLINYGKGMNDNNTESETYNIENSIVEMSAKTEHQFPTVGIHNISMGIGFVNNTTSSSEDIREINPKAKTYSSNRINYYLKDNIAIGRLINIQPGIKVDFLHELNDYYLQPRIDAVITPHSNWKINMAWGIYKQYISEMRLLDELNNSYYFWGLSDNSEYPVVEGMHNVLGVSFKNSGFKFGTEGFYKTTEGLSRFVYYNDLEYPIQLKGKSRAYGIDFYLKKEIAKHDFWVSYTLSRTEENFLKRKESEYIRAPQDQTHEVKGSAVFNFKPWYFSANYVYGSGLVSSTGIMQDGVEPYNRLDIAFLYKFKTQKFNLEAGLSVVNALNIKNVGYGGISNLPDDRKVYSQGMPFTPSVFLNIGF